MNRSILKKYAPQARRDFIQAVTDRASYYGLTKKKTEPVTVQGDTALIGGRAFPKKVADQRKRLEERIARRGFDQVMEAVAYTWFNRLVAIRFMELHGYLEHGYRVLSHPSSGSTPEILEHADSVDLPGLDPQQVIELKLAGNKDSELYRMLLIAQCNALHSAMPFLFERIDDETELLLPDNLLHSDSLIRTLVSEIPEEDWQEVEIIGWLYQFYISEKKDQVIGKVVKSEDIPAATQLFTPNWIVKYLVQNSLGRQWVATYPNSPLKGEMEYYIEPAEQTPEVQEQLKAITPDSLDPEELTLLDPACGSGHILVEAYDLLKAIYQERGYPKKDIPRLILTKNLYGLEIDDRAAQLAAFTLMMKARADDRRIFAQGIQPHVLSIQESKGLDAKEITDALNDPILKTKLPPSGELFEEIADEKAGLFSKKSLSVKGDISQADVAHLIDLFEHGKTFGSLIQVPEKLAEKLPAIAQRVEDVLAKGDLFGKSAAHSLQPLVIQSKTLARRYDAVIANPPYMGSTHYNATLKKFIKTQYPECKADLYSCFVSKNLATTKIGGSIALITISNWLFLSAFEEFRQLIFDGHSIDSLIHNGRGVWGSDFGSCMFVIRNESLPQFKATYKMLFDKHGSVASNEELMDRFHSGDPFYASVCDFPKVPGSPIAYWITDAVRNAFSRHELLKDYADGKVGLQTSDNDRFLRYWYEVAFPRICLNANNGKPRGTLNAKWIPYNKGGLFRRWYGNIEHVVNWEDDGKEIQECRPKSVIRNPEYHFREGITWSDVTISDIAVRYLPPGCISDSAGHSAYFATNAHLWKVLAMMNTHVTNRLTKIVNPTVHFHVGYFNKLPYVPDVPDAVADIAQQATDISRRDWNLHETSWEFESHPFLSEGQSFQAVATAFKSFLNACNDDVQRLNQLEIQNNKVFIECFGLQDELSPEVPADQITLYRPDREEDIQRLISYAIGCMMGRYSLDKPGLIYANSGGEGFDPSQYQTFPADSDGIIPITEFEWFVDDAANRLEDFIATAWPKDHLEENLKFIAESIGQKKSESARDAIRRYLSTGFYKHHLSLYKKRPIYWLFSSGKQRAFQCLVYLHRYNAGTLSRMRTEYVIPLQGKIESRIDQLELDIEAASSTSHQKKLTKERDTLVKHREELQTFDEKLRHYADQRITLDLDDGVKVNYGKFGDLLAEVKAITGIKPD